jgi:hypothetical protein
MFSCIPQTQTYIEVIIDAEEENLIAHQKR